MSDLIKRARGLSDAATPGPWITHDEYTCVIVRQDDPFMSLLALDKENTAIFAEQADATFVAAARQLVPDLCDEIERLQRALAEAKGSTR